MGLILDNNVKDEVHITKQDYLNRLNALKNNCFNL